MRKEVRLGFGLGGVMLAIIIVAVLVLHKNKNGAVAFDKGTPAAATDGSGAATADPAAAKSTDAADASAAAPASAGATTPASPAADLATAAKAPTAAADHWDALFAAPPADGSSKSKSSNGSASKSGKSHKSSSALAESSMAVANGSVAVSNPPETVRSSSRGGAGAALSAPAVSTTASTRTHRVEPGETFVSIARAVYGDGKYFQTIIEANPNVVPEKLHPGVIIQLPALTPVKKSPVKTSAAPAATAGGLSADGKTYTVQKGDSLYKIARRIFGNGEMDGDLYALNRQVIGPDSTRLKIGMVLKVAEKAKENSVSSASK
jgi:nucleoid-associated protein YgaU